MMKMRNDNRRMNVTVMITLLGVVMGGMPVSAITATWSGSGNWSDTGNPGWGGTAPNAIGDVAQYTNSAANGITTQNVASTVSVGTILLSATKTWSIRRSGGNTITMDNTGSSNALIRHNAGNPGLLVIDPDLIINDTLEIRNENASNPGMLVTGTITSASAGLDVKLLPKSLNAGFTPYITVGTVNNQGMVYVGTASGGTGSQVTIGGIGANVTGLDLAGMLAPSTLILNGTNAYAGNTTLQAGTLQIGSPYALSSGKLVWNGGQLQARVNLNGAGAVTNEVVVGTPPVFSGTKVLELAGLMDLGGVGRTFLVTNTADTIISGVISNGPASGVGLVKDGSGRLIISGANTYGASTVVSNGVLEASGANRCFGTGPVTVDGGEVRVAAAANLNTGSKVLVSANGILGLSGSVNPGTDGANFIDPASLATLLAIDCTNFSANLDQSKLLNGQMYIGSVAGGTVTNCAWAPCADGVYRLGGGGGILALNSSNILNGASYDLVCAGQVTMGAFQTFRNAIITNNGVLKTAASNVFPSASTFMVAAGSTVDVENVTTLGGLSGAGTLYNNGQVAITLNNAADCTFTGTGRFFRVTFVKTGAGAFNLGGQFSDTGSPNQGLMILSNGIVRLSANNAMSTNTITQLFGGTLDLSGHNQILTSLGGNNNSTVYETGAVTNSDANTASTLTLAYPAPSTRTGTDDFDGTIGGRLSLNLMRLISGNNTWYALKLRRPCTYTGDTSSLGVPIYLTNSATLGGGNVSLAAAFTNSATILDLTGLTNAVGGYVAAIAPTATLTLTSTNLSGTPYYPAVAFGARTFTNRVSALIVDGASQTPGVYTSAQLPNFITGSGAIKVAVPAAAKGFVLRIN